MCFSEQVPLHQEFRAHRWSFSDSGEKGTQMYSGTNGFQMDEKDPSHLSNLLP
jgi:hypothetical protein